MDNTSNEASYGICFSHFKAIEFFRLRKIGIGVGSRLVGPLSLGPRELTSSIKILIVDSLACSGQVVLRSETCSHQTRFADAFCGFEGKASLKHLLSWL